MGSIAVLEPTQPEELRRHVEELAASARSLHDASRASSTRSAYASDFADFADFCDRLGQPSLPADADVVALYIAELASHRQLAVSTINRRLAAVSVAHAEAGHDSPTRHPAIRRMLSGLRRTRAGAVTKERRALSSAELSLIVKASDSDLADLRDQALLLCGFVGGLRRSEIVGIDVEDLTLSDSGYLVAIRRSKTDQEGNGRTIVLPYSEDAELCPVRALNKWLTEASVGAGPVFRRVRRGGSVSDDRLSGQSIGLILKKRAKAVGIDPSRLGAHSLRSGFATAAAAQGANERTIARQTGHRSTQVLRRYIHQATAFDDNAATDLGL